MRLSAICLAVGLLYASANAARAGEPACCAPDLSGHWVGCWSSDKNGHHGPLRATFTKVSENCYHVRFFGRFFKVIPFTYAVKLAVTENRGNEVVLSGALTLGPVFGKFQTDAVATSTAFRADFQSKGDYGKFVLNRVK